MEGLTRISDLPDNITMTNAGPVFTSSGSGPGSGSSSNTTYSPNIDIGSGPGSGSGSQQPPVTSGYTPLNVHSNPYGQGPPSQMPPPQYTKVNSNGSPDSNPYLNMGLGNEANLAGPHAHLGNMPQYPLPQRDIPMDITSYMQDEMIQPSYMPSMKTEGGYVESQEERIRRQRKAKRGKLFSGNWTMDDIIAELQQPIIVGILFFIFQSPMVHTAMAKYLSFMKLFEEDGNINTTGIFIKSVFFGLCYFAWGRFVEYLEQ